MKICFKKTKQNIKQSKTKKTKTKQNKRKNFPLAGVEPQTINM